MNVVSNGKSNIIISNSIAFTLILLVISLLSGYSYAINAILAYFLIYLSFVFVYLSRYSIPLFLVSIFIAYVNYSVSVGIYIDKSLRPDVLYSKITNIDIYGEGIFSMVLFMAVVITAYYNEERYIERVRRTVVNKYVEILCFVLYVVIFFTQIEFVEGERMRVSAISEYRYLFAIIGGTYSSKSKLSKVWWSTMIFITSILTFIGGNRVDAFPGIFILITIWYSDLSVKSILKGLLIAIPLLQTVGYIRGNFAEVASDDLFGLFKHVMSEKMVQGTFTFAYFPSLSFIELGNIQDWTVKIDLFFKNIVYIFWGGSYGQYTPSDYTWDFYEHYWGFVAPVTFNFWLNIFGPLVLGLIIRKIVKLSLLVEKKNLKSNSLINCLFLIFICSCPRWYCYNFFQLPRAFILGLGLFVCFKVIHKFTVPFIKTRLEKKSYIR